MPAAREPASVPTGARWFVRVFLAAFFICAVFRIEAWPLTGFRLFSSLRTSTGTTWVADTVGADGTETRLWFSDLPRPYQGFHLVTLGFRRLPASQQRAMCTAWLDEARRLRPGVAKIGRAHV